MKKQKHDIIPFERIASTIYKFREQPVILDRDLALLYGVTTKRLNQQIRRNLNRFPQDFMFQLNPEESESLKLQNQTPKGTRGGRRYLPFVFTEHGAIMVASVLNTPRAIEISVFVVRAFIKMREMLATQKEVVHALMTHEHRLDSHEESIQELNQAYKQLMQPPQPKKLKIGFKRGK